MKLGKQLLTSQTVSEKKNAGARKLDAKSRIIQLLTESFEIETKYIDFWSSVLLLISQVHYYLED